MSVSNRLADGSVFAERYRIVRWLGRGSEATVYLGEPLVGGALVALKLLDFERYAEPQARQRVERAARVTELVPSNHVVQVLAAGIDQEHGFAWLAMEWLRGHSLAALLGDPTPLTRHEQVSVLRQLFAAMAAAHQAGVVHGDLKPENIVVVADPTGRPGPFVKVLDLGIAKRASPSARSAPTEALGTSLWVAPEQGRDGESPGPAADVWALALIAFRVLTGKLYWHAAADEHPSTAALTQEIMRGPSVAASTRAAELGRASCVPEGFDGWFACAVAREPADRFRDAGVAWRSLEPLLGPLLAVRAPARTPLAASGMLGWLTRAWRRLASAPTGHARLAATTGAVAVAMGCAGSSAELAPAFLHSDEAALLSREGGDGAMPIVEIDPRAPSASSVLRKRAQLLDPTDRRLGQLVARMRATLEKSGGVGLAAPQVGVSRRLILVRHGTRPEGQPTRVAVYVNPRIEWASESIDEDYEGCLSMPGVGGLVPRARQIRLHYQLPGQHDELSVELVDWDARIVQHEMDHLNGTLYVDRLRGELLSQEETKRLRDEGHRRRGWLRAATEPPPAEGARP